MSFEPWLDDGDVRIHVGDVREVLAGLPDESVDCVITSPPYWGLRDYGTGSWAGGDPDCDHLAPPTGGPNPERYTPGGGEMFRAANDKSFRDVCGKCGAQRQDQQLGLEPTPDLYVASMVAVFREVRRVLTPHGTCWVNLGSSYFQGESYPMREIDAAWLAAIIDGEGCIQVHQQRRPAETNSVDSFQVDVGVGMMTPEVVQRCHEITGLGSCKLQNRGVWDWSVRGQQAAQLLRAIYPYLIGKRKQAALAIMLADDLAARRYGRGNPAQPEVMAWRAQIRQAVSDCNQRRGTEFPIVEPKPLVLGLKQKDDVGVPWAVARALRDDGWYLRSEVIWAKPNPMPESVTDRPTKSHEQVFLLTKSPRYWFDAEAVREPPSPFTRPGRKNGEQSPVRDEPHHRRANLGLDYSWQNASPGRNVRSVWNIATQPFAQAHFATFPEELVRRCLLAGCPSEICRALICCKCGVPHPTATVESLWDAETGRDEIPEPNAVQAELRRVRDVLREQESARLLEELRGQVGDVEAEHENEGRADQSPGLYSAVDAGLPVGDDCEGLRVGASVRDGTASRAETRVVGEGASSQRGQGGQPAGEPGDRDALDAPWGGRVPGLRDALLRSLTCPACDSCGFRVCGKPRERIVVPTDEYAAQSTRPGLHTLDREALRLYLIARREDAGLSRAELDRRIGVNGASAWWEGRNYLGEFVQQVPSWGLYQALKSEIGLDDRFDEQVRRVDQDSNFRFREERIGEQGPSGVSAVQPAARKMTAERVSVGWSDCGHNNYRPGIVLDPFLGSGTTALVARHHGRHAIGIELNPEYAQIAARRLQQLSLGVVA